MAEVVFILGDKLPLIYDAAISIYSVSKKSDCPKRAATIHAYADSLKCMWEKAFGREHVCTIKTIKRKLENIMKDYKKQSAY